MKSIRIVGDCAALTLLLALGPLALAQTAGTEAQHSEVAGTSELSEVVVTAEKRTENVEKAPATISVVTGDELQERGVEDIRTAAVMFPSVKFGAVESSTHLYIRGIGAEQDRASIDPLSAMTQDGINLPREVTGNSFFDISSIEVLPGPQSTLYGTSAAGGIVNITNNRPVDRSEGSMLLETGNYSLAHVSAMQNVPLQDNLFLRAAVDYGSHDGYMTSGGDSLDQFGGRVSLLYTPFSDFTAYIWGSYNNTGGEAANTTTLVPGDHNFADPKNPWNDYVCTPTGALGANPLCDTFYIGAPAQSFHTSIIGGQFDYHVSGMTFTMIPGFLYDNGTELQYFGPFPNYQVISNHQYSDELRVTSDSEKPLKWNGGLYAYRDSQYQFFSVNNTLAQNLQAQAGNPQIWNRETTLAAFGQATYSVTDSIRATAGLRYSSNQKTANGCNCSAGGGQGVYFTFGHTWPRLDWKAGVEADLPWNTLWYATVQTGYDNGAYQYFNTSGLLGPQNAGPAPLVEPSKLVSYSTGTKSRLFDNRLEVNNEIYYYDYKDLLIAPFDDNPAHYGNTFYNANTVEIYGDELDVKFLLTPHDRLQVNFNYNHARAIDFIVGNPPVNYGGLQLIEAPDITTSASFQHVMPLPNGADLDTTVATHYENGFWGTFDHSPTTHQPAFTMTDLTVTYRAASGKWSVAGWGKNLENVAVLGPGAYVGAGDIQGVYWLLPPRTWGVRLDVHW
ncbi:MAG TPA: TonB-dependent receptor [Steroidobacteraceae bacterium]